jgi:stage II sporulation protein M
MIHKKSKTKKSNLAENYQKCWQYIKESRTFIFIIIGIFFLFAIIGFLVPAPDSVSALISNYIREIINETSGMSWIQLISFIFFNNLKSSFFGMIFGIFFGIFPSLVALFNGYILGFVSNESVQTNGIFVLWKLLPHGIFELPAVFISLGLGIKLASKLFERKGKFGENFINASRVFLFVVIPLLIIAAIIEGTLIVLFH